MPFLFHAAGISRSQGDHFKTEGHFKNSQREFISSRLCRLLIAALSYQRLPPRGSWILRSKRLKEIALVKTLHKFHLYALSLSHLRCQLPPGRSLKTQRPHCVHFQLSIFNFQLSILNLSAGASPPPYIIPHLPQANIIYKKGQPL